MPPLSEIAHERAAACWRAQLEHPFVRGVADGTLDAKRFGFFIRQDYLYLIDYGRVFALAAARAPRPELIARFAELAVSTLRGELQLHRGYAARWGITAAELDAEPPAPATRAYTDFLLRTATLGDFGELMGALLPCVWGYSELGRALAAGPRSGHALYADWIDTYADPEFSALADWCRLIFDELGEQAGVSVTSGRVA